MFDEFLAAVPRLHLSSDPGPLDLPLQGPLDLPLMLPCLVVAAPRRAYASIMGWVGPMLSIFGHRLRGGALHAAHFSPSALKSLAQQNLTNAYHISDSCFSVEFA